MHKQGRTIPRVDSGVSQARYSYVEGMGLFCDAFVRLPPILETSSRWVIVRWPIVNLGSLQKSCETGIVAMEHIRIVDVCAAKHVSLLHQPETMTLQR